MSKIIEKNKVRTVLALQPYLFCSGQPIFTLPSLL